MDPQEEDKGKTFRFDEVFDSNSAQQQVYDEAAFQIIEAAAEGYNGNLCFIHFQVLSLPMDKLGAVRLIL